MMKPFIKTGHRYGNVFLRIVHQWMGKRASHVAKLTPDDAESIGRGLVELARRARKEPRDRAVLKIKKGTR